MRLRGILEHTASWATIDDDGSLVVELYDFSAEAHRWLGNDVAFVLKLDPAGKDQAAHRLLCGETNAPERDGFLLRAIEERFVDYHAIKEWLEEQGIPFRKEFEPWA